MRQVHRQQQPYLTVGIIIACVAVFLVNAVWTVSIPYRDGPVDEGVLNLEGLLYGPAVADCDWWRPITVGFTHANIMHIAFNMFLLFLLGQMLEPVLGRLRYFALFAASLMGGSLLILLMSPDQRTVGASGAVFGLMGAAFIGMRSRGVDPFSTGIGPLLVINLILTFLMPGISIAGHLGGLAAGAAAGWLLFEQAERMERGQLITTAVCLAAVVAMFMLSLEVPEPTLDPRQQLPSAFDYM